MNRNKYTIFLFLIPTLAFGILLLYFVFYNVYYSFLDSSATVLVAKFVGLGTYKELFSNSLAVSSMKRSIIWAFVLIIGANLMGIFFASLIYFLRNQKTRAVYTSIFVYPLAVSMAASGVIWTWLFNINDGVDYLFVRVGLPKFPWLDSPSTAFPSLILVSIWVFSGLASLFYLASFQNVSKDIVESAKIDSASSFRILRKVLLPEAKNAFIVSTAIIFIFALRFFSLPYVATLLNPYTETSVENLYVLYTSLSFSESSAESVIVMLIALVVVIPFALYGIKRWLAND